MLISRLTGPARRLGGHAGFRYGWDTRCRNLAPARLLRPLLAPEAARGAGPGLLDVGCGRLGVAGFLPEVTVVGLDLEPPEEMPANFSFTLGDATALPFADRSFPVVNSIDMLEHLPHGLRARAIEEIVRVAGRAVLIAFPHGPRAQDCDDNYRRESEARGRIPPPWVDEHLRQAYPTVPEVAEQLRAAARRTGRAARLSEFYCEPLAVSRVVRAAAARSDLLYTGVNLLFGALLGLMPVPAAEASYRGIILAELSPGDPGEGGDDAHGRGAA